MKERVKDPRRAFRRREIVGRDVHLLRDIKTGFGILEKGERLHVTAYTKAGWYLRDCYRRTFVHARRRDFEVLL